MSELDELPSPVPSEDAVFASVMAALRSRTVAQIAADPSEQADVLSYLSRHRVAWLRVKVAGNPSTLPGTLRRLSLDVDGFVRGAVASNLSAPAVVLEGLAEDAWETVRCAVASNPSTSVSLFPVLLGRDGRSVVEAVSERVWDVGVPFPSLAWLLTADDVPNGLRMVASGALARRWDEFEDWLRVAHPTLDLNSMMLDWVLEAIAAP